VVLYIGPEKRILAGGTAYEGQKKTAFSNGQGLWQFTVMPFGLAKLQQHSSD